MSRSDSELRLMICKEASEMLQRIILNVFTYNAERRKTPSNSGEIHYRTLELLLRYTEAESDRVLREKHMRY